jgi:hypothetical protein
VFFADEKSAGAAIRPRQRIEPAEKTVNSAGMLLLGETHVTLTAHLRLNAWRPLLYSPSCSQSKMIVSSGENTMNRNVIIGIIVLAIIILAVIFFMPGTAETPPATETTPPATTEPAPTEPAPAPTTPAPSQ